MDLADLIESMKNATKGSRAFDAQIAQALGWTLQVVPDPTRPKGKRYVWSNDEPGDDPIIVPSYSTNLHDAYQLCVKVYPEHVGGFAWEGKYYKARIGEESRTVIATTGPLALCIAAMQHLSRRSV